MTRPDTILIHMEGTGCWEIPAHLGESVIAFFAALDMASGPVPSFNKTIRFTPTGDDPSNGVVRPFLRHVPAQKKIGCIKLVREFYGSNLKESKETVEKCPCHLSPLLEHDAKRLSMLAAMDGITIELPNILDKLARVL